MTHGVQVVKFIVNSGGSDAAGCFAVKVRTDTAKFTIMRITRFRQSKELTRESEVFVKYKASILRAE